MTLPVSPAEGNSTWGVNGETGELVDMNQLKIWEPLAVKLQTVKTAVEVSTARSDSPRCELAGRALRLPGG